MKLIDLVLYSGVWFEVAFSRIVAIGDLHGDYEQALKAYRLAGVIDRDGNWSGGNTTLIQTGDVLDRGSETIKLFEFIMKLQKDAKRKGGNYIQLLGNHETMNLKEDFRFVTDDEIDSFGGSSARAEAFSKDGWLGSYLRSLNITALVDGTVFVHGGINIDWAKYGVNGLNRKSHRYLQNDSVQELKKREIYSSHHESPLWYQKYAVYFDQATCNDLELALRSLSADRMVMGHTIFDTYEIITHCDGRAIFIDVGISKFFHGGHVAALELTPHSAKALYIGKTVDLPIPIAKNQTISYSS